MIIKNLKTTSSDQKYFSSKEKLLDAHRAGKLGKEWYVLNPKNGKYELRPHHVYKHV